MDYFNSVSDFVSGGVPSYHQTIKDVKWGVEYCHQNCNESSSYYPNEFFSAMHKYATVNIEKDLLTIFGMAALWTLLRYVLSIVIFKVISINFDKALWLLGN